MDKADESKGLEPQNHISEDPSAVSPLHRMDKVDESRGLEPQNHTREEPSAVSPEQVISASMAVNSAHNVATKTEWGEIDTTAPFESVKAAVTLFGEGVLGGKVGGRRLTFPVGERRIAKETKLHQVLKELDKTKEQLKNAEATKAQALLELEEAKNLVNDLMDKLEKAKESKEVACEGTEIARLHVELEHVNTDISEDRNTSWQAEAYSAREKLVTTIAELDAAKQELRTVKKELAASLEAKVWAVKQAEEALIAAETNSKRVGKLMEEIAASNESLVLVKLACVEAEKERANILAEKEAETQKSAVTVENSSKQLEALRQKLDASKDLERKLASTVAAVENLQKEITFAKDSQSNVAEAASNANDKLSKVKLGVEDIENAASPGSSSLESLSIELKESIYIMQKAMAEELSLRVSMDALKMELEQVRKELAETKQKELDREAAAANLNAELNNHRSNLAVAVATQTKAKNATADLSFALEQLTIEIENARKEAEAMKAESEKAKLEVEQAKVALDIAEGKLEAAKKEADAAKAAEETALGRIEALSKETIAARASTCESGALIAVSQDEYNSLSRKFAEANELSNMKVAAALAQVDAIKAAEQELLMKLEAAHREIEETKSVTEQALHKAQMAEAAKRAVEGELRKWREREQRKRSALLEAAQQFTNNAKGDVSKSSTEAKSVHSEPLGKVLNIKIGSPEKLDHVHPVNRSFTLKKKKQLISNIGAIFVKKEKSHG